MTQTHSSFQYISLLLVEDNVVNQIFTKRVLEHQVGSMTLATNGLEALAQCQKTRFNLILMDIQMPEMDGLEATRKIRHLEEQRGQRPTPIIALTATADEPTRRACLQAGMQDVLLKPIQPKTLMMRLEQLLEATA